MNDRGKQEELLRNFKQDVEGVFDASSSSKFLLLTLGALRRAIFQPGNSEMGHEGKVAVALEPMVENVKDYCTQRARCEVDTNQRNAYDFMRQHITDMRPDLAELHATCCAWAMDHRRRAQQLRQEAICSSLAEELENTARVCDDLDKQLQDTRKS